MTNKEIIDIARNILYNYKKDEGLSENDISILDSAILIVRVLWEKEEIEKNKYESILKFICNLLSLCDVSKKDARELFVPLRNKGVDYMGTGYVFLDKFNKIYLDFLCEMPDKVCRDIESYLCKK